MTMVDLLHEYYVSHCPLSEYIWLYPLSAYQMGTGGSFFGDKRPEHEADHLPPASTEVKNEWRYTSTHPCVFMAWSLVKHSNNIRVVLW